MKTEGNENQKQSFFDRYSTTVKLVVIGVLTLLLLIPLGMISSLIRERESNKETVIADITSKWGSEQTITGPYLIITYYKPSVEGNNNVKSENKLLLLPSMLDIDSDPFVEKRKRGIYDVSVYTADITFDTKFDLNELSKINVQPEWVNWNEVSIAIGISDLKGIKEQVAVEINGEKDYLESGVPLENITLGSGVSTRLKDIDADTLLKEMLSVSVSLKVSGSYGFYVTPIGKTTVVKMNSDWLSPKFDGEFLPVEREITEDGFTAQWKVLDLNRGYGQVFNTDNVNAINLMAASRFGVKFTQSVDQYQQNMRSVKYAVLIVLLTFVVVFFIELFQKKWVNPFQYLLVGVALVLFYALLLSVSEVIGFDLAYLLSALMTTLLIFFHMSSILSRKHGLIIGGILAFLYLFVFILIKMESYSLLAGSLGLFAILAVIMHFSKRLKF